MGKKKTIKEINRKLQAGSAVVFTADELEKLLKNGEKVRWQDVDIVTTATCGLMSGTVAVLSFTITGRGEFTRAQEILLNGVPAYPGPCPNERLGVIDLIVYGTEHSISDNNYGGGHLFKDLAAGKSIHAKVKSKNGKKLEKDIKLNEMGYARLHGIRHCFKNYIGMVNTSKTPVPSIFHVYPLKGPYKEVSVCGCGALNPLANDPELNVIGVGTKILINDAIGYVTGLGTRASPEKPNLSAFAELKDMDPYYMGGFITSEGPEVIASWAVPIPILNKKIFDNVTITDDRLPLPIANISDRIPFTNSDYARVWQGTDLTVKFSSEKCKTNIKNCKKNNLMINNQCPVERICPVHAFKTIGSVLNRKLCFNCGACVRVCTVGCFKMNLGTVKINGRRVPITLRQSDKARAIKLAKQLKKKILNGSFVITEKIADLTF